MKDNKPTIQDVLMRFYPAYLQKHTPSSVQEKTVTHILNCKTGSYGINVSTCQSCGHKVIHYNSCRDRSCPMCQALSNELWVDAQTEHILDIDYYHVVFTCPSELYSLIYCNQKELYALFFQAAKETLMEMSEDSRYAGGTPGFICILHTWGSNLSYHPHLHVLITGGGLGKDRHWYQKRDGFFLPGKAMTSLFKGKFLSALKQLWKSSKLSFYEEAEKYRNHYFFKELLDHCYQKQWVTDIRESFAGAETVMHYLGRYTHRIAISNSRILQMDEKTVTFKVKNYKKDGKWKELTLDGEEFIRRFLMHIPPKSFVRIRHYGLLSNCKKKKVIPLCRNLIGCREFLSRFKGLDKPSIIKKLYNRDITRCPCCGEKMEYQVHPKIHYSKTG